jgi:hypothetical protein
LRGVRSLWPATSKCAPALFGTTPSWPSSSCSSSGRLTSRSAATPYRAGGTSLPSRICASTHWPFTRTTSRPIGNSPSTPSTRNPTCDRCRIHSRLRGKLRSAVTTTAIAVLWVGALHLRAQAGPQAPTAPTYDVSSVKINASTDPSETGLGFQRARCGFSQERDSAANHQSRAWSGVSGP